MKNKKGFSLIELLVVIGIIAVLAAIAIPTVAGLVDKANASADTTNANEMTNAIERFVSEYTVYCEDISADKINTEKLDSVQARVYSITRIEDTKDIANIEMDGEEEMDGQVALCRDTKYPLNAYTAKQVICTYIKTSSATFEPKQSNKHYWYSPDCGIVVVAEKDANIENLNKMVVSGRDAYGNALSSTTKWINLTNSDMLRFSIAYKSDLLESDNGKYFQVIYYFNKDGSGALDTYFYESDKTTKFDTRVTSYSIGTFKYEKNFIYLEGYKFAEIIDGGKTVMQLDTVHGDIPLKSE